MLTPVHTADDEIVEASDREFLDARVKGSDGVTGPLFCTRLTASIVLAVSI